MREEQVIQAYQSMWNQRSSIDKLDFTEMCQMIRSELLEELTHPRARKTPIEKFQIVKSRIGESTMPDQIKKDLIDLYLVQLHEITGNVNPN